MMYSANSIKKITPIGIKNVVDITVENNHTFVTSNDIVVHNCNSTQPALRNFMEEFSRNCGFILTCNFKNRIIEPLHSRCSVVEFKIKKKDLPELAKQMLKRLCNILDTEGVEYDRAVVAELIKKHYPDWRRIINELQRYSVTGKIDSGLLANITESTFKQAVTFMKERDYTSLRKWVAENIDTDSTAIFRLLYDTASVHIDTSSIPLLVIILAKYQYQSAFVADHEINLVACLTEIMADCKFL